MANCRTLFQVVRRRALALLSQREGSNFIPSFLFSLPGVSVWLSAVREISGIVKSLAENLAVFIVVAGLIMDMGWSKKNSDFIHSQS